MAAARPAWPLSRRRTLSGAIAFLVVAAVGLSVVGGVFAFKVHAAEQEQARREAVVQAARQQAVNLMSLNYQTLDRDIQRILDGATGQLEQQFNSNAEQLRTVVPQVKAVTSGEVLSAGVVKVDGDSAKVLLVVDQTVRNESGGGSQGGSGSGSQDGSGNSSQGGSGSGSGGGSNPQEALKHYRMSMTLQQEEGRWLASKLEFL